MKNKVIAMPNDTARNTTRFNALIGLHGDIDYALGQSVEAFGSTLMREASSASFPRDAGNEFASSGLKHQTGAGPFNPSAGQANNHNAYPTFASFKGFLKALNPFSGLFPQGGKFIAPLNRPDLQRMSTKAPFISAEPIRIPSFLDKVADRLARAFDHRLSENEDPANWIRRYGMKIPSADLTAAEAPDLTNITAQRERWEQHKTTGINTEAPDLSTNPLDSLLKDYPDVKAVSDPKEMSRKGTFADYVYLQVGLKNTPNYKVYIFDTSEIAKQDPSGEKWHKFLRVTIDKLGDGGGIVGGISKENAVTDTTGLVFRDGAFIKVN